MTTIQDVARSAGVSAATVSRVMNGVPTVDQQLVERVHRAMKDLGYRRNAVARSLRRSSTNLWAVIVSDVENPFFTSLVRGVEDVAQATGYSVVLCNTDEDPAKVEQYLDVVLDEQMAGVIISTSGRSRRLKELISGGTAAVAIDRRPAGVDIDTVLVDNEGAAAMATGHLIDQGFERIACITGPKRVSTASARLRGFTRAHRARGLVQDGTLVRHADFREEGGYAAMESLLAGDRPPDAVFATNNLMTVGAIACLVDHGIDIPGQVGLVGFDEVPWARLVRPRLSTVAQPTYELGRTAAVLLGERLATPTRPASTVTLPAQLIVRDSSQRVMAEAASRRPRS